MSLPDYYKLLAQIKVICDEFGIQIQEIPNFVVGLVLYKTPCTGEGNKFGAFNFNNDTYESIEVAKCFPKDIYTSLSDQQINNVVKTLRRNGRVLINDSFGSGKKFTAIATAIIYRPEWPLLIICPNVLVRSWIHEFVKWIPKLNKKTKLQVIDDLTLEFKKTA